jgi:osmotically-inducible protein OsmY
MRKTALCALAAAAAFALPAQARWFHHDEGYHATYRGAPENHAIHTAASTYDDQLLADRIADALRDDPSLNDTTVTVAVVHGRVALSGSAPDGMKAQRAEQIASAVAGRGAVSGTIDTQGA